MSTDLQALAAEAMRLEEEGHYSLAAKAWERVDAAREERSHLDPELARGAAEALMQFIGCTDCGFTCDEAARLDPFIRAVLGDEQGDAFHRWHASTDSDEGDCSHDEYLVMAEGGFRGNSQ